MINKTKGRLIFCITLVVLNVAFIWANSLMSQKMSSAFSQLIGRIISLFLPGEGAVASGTGHGILRKIAHVTEFASLAFLLSWLCRMLFEEKWKYFVLPIGVGVVIASIDELLQRLIPGRGPRVRDVGIDTIGLCLGACAMWGLTALIRRRKEKKNELH